MHARAAELRGGGARVATLYDVCPTHYGGCPTLYDVCNTHY